MVQPRSPFPTWQRLLAVALLFAALLPGPARAQNPGWMYSLVHDGTHLSSLTIPGTHDSGALHNGAAPAGTANAQDMTIPAQLNAGVRFLDIRLNFSPAHDLPPGTPLHDELYVYHGVVPQLVSADTVFTWLRDFLLANRGEMILLSIKNEVQIDKSDSNAHDFQTAVEKLLDKYSPFILSTTRVPHYSSDVRDLRRIVIVRRYPLMHASAAGVPRSIDATQGWPAGNAAQPIADLVGGQLKVQDRYDFVCSGLVHCNLANAEEKAMRGEKRDALFKLVDEAINQEGDFNGVHKLRISFASASLHARLNPIPTEGVIGFFASSVNAALSSQRSNTYRARAGVVLLDRATPALIDELVGMNPLRPFESGPASTSGGTARIDEVGGRYCNVAPRGVCFTLPSGADAALGGTAIGRPAVALGPNNNETSVFIVGTDHALYTRWQTSATTSPLAFNPDWVSLGGYLTSDPAALRNCSGEMEVFARGGEHAIYTNWQVARGGSWNGWVSLGGIAHSRPLVSSSGCTVTLSVIGADGLSWKRTRSNGVWGSWTRA